MKGETAPKIKFARRLPFYYGWLMVPVAFIAQAVTGVGQTYGISVFNPSLLETLDISLSALTGAYLAGTLLAALPQAYIGYLMDRFGIRRTMTVVVILLGGACLFFAQINSLLTLLIGFFLLRLLGQGGLSLLSGNIAAMWFREKLGTVTGIISGGFSISMAVVPAFFLYLINQTGWRSAYSWLGIMVWAVMLPLLLLIFRNNPGDVGQYLDGKSTAEENQAEIDLDDKNSFTLMEARQTPAYWITMVNVALWAMIVTAVFFNLLSIFGALGISKEVAAATYTTYAAASLLTQILLGPAANRGPLHVLLLLSMVCLAAGIGVLSIASTAWLAHLYAVLTGFSTGLIVLVGGTLFARYYGRKHLGKLRGSVLTAQVAASSLGPFITGVIYDLTGSFQISLWIFMGILVPAAVLSLKAIYPQKTTLRV
ncbi:MAG: MFS transporter [Anaerolineales bacterium]|nr:MFS transporter [Anaerolineales bacterium]